MNSEKPPKPREQTLQTPEKKILDQITPETGITQDYANEFSWAFTGGMADFFDEDVADKTKRAGKPLLRYEERYSPEIYADVVTEKNHNLVNALNAIADEVNALSKAGELTREVFVQKTREMARLIYGEHIPKGYLEKQPDDDEWPD